MATKALHTMPAMAIDERRAAIAEDSEVLEHETVARRPPNRRITFRGSGSSSTSTNRPSSYGAGETRAAMSPSFDFLNGNIYSDDDDDAESTVLGHHVNNASSLPSTTPNIPSNAHLDTSRRSRVSGNTRSSIASSSKTRRSFYDNDEFRNLIANDNAGATSNPPARRASDQVVLIRQSVASNVERPDTSRSLRSVSSLRSLRPHCPPPNMPLPPKPPGTPRSISGKSDSWRLSDASAHTALSVSPDTRSSLQSRAVSSRLTDRSSRSHARADSSDMSASELDSIRHISSSFPTPVSASFPSQSSARHIPSQRMSRSSSKTRTSIRSSYNSRNSQISRQSSADCSQDEGHRTLQLSENRLHKDRCSSIEETESGGEASDSALSDVLDLTDNHGVLSVAKKIGRASSRRRSPRLVLRVKSASPSRSQDVSPRLERRSVEPLTRTQNDSPSGSRPDHATQSAPTLKLEEEGSASKDETSLSTSRDVPDSVDKASKPSRGLTETAARSGPLASTDSMPSLASASSLELSHGSQRRLSGDSSFPCSSSSRSRESSSFVELNSIYDAYRNSNGTMASRLTAPVVRIEGPEGEEMSDSELGESSVDAPRKRTKQERRNQREALGFDEQRAPIRSASVTSRTLRPGQIFSPSLQSNTEVMPGKMLSGNDPYAFYEFSPSLPPFVPSGLSPRDLTGTGTWSSIVARASERMNASRQSSVASLSSLTSKGPISMRDIKAAAKVKQQQAEAARRARESLSTHVSALSYRPFAIHDHALNMVNRHTSSPHSWTGSEPNGTELASSSGHGYADSSVSELATRWPIAVGSDQVPGIEDLALFNNPSLSRRPSAQQKVYVEFCMQTSPKSSPTSAKTELADISTQSEPLHVEGQSVNPKETSKDPSCLLKIKPGAPVRRKSAASLITMSYTNLDEAGVWPLKVRAPRLSSARSLYNLRTTNRRSSTSVVSVVAKGAEDNRLGVDSASNEGESSEESDLDLETNLELLAERSGVLDETRGAKRKLGMAADSDVAESSSVAQRKIASIPARSQRISAALKRIQSDRASRSAEWLSSEDEEEDESRGSKVITDATSPRLALGARTAPQEPRSAPAKMSRAFPAYHRSVSWTMNHRRVSESRVSRARSSSPDLGVLLNQSDEEEVLLTADVDADGLKASNGELLDDHFDSMVGKGLKSCFAVGGSNSPQRESLAGNLQESSANPAVTAQQPAPSENTELTPGADELLSSNGHSVGHSSGHDTFLSDTGGTSGHDPQRPNLVLAEIVKRRLEMKMKIIMSNASSKAAGPSVLPQIPVPQGESLSSPLAIFKPKTSSCEGDPESTDVLESSTRSPVVQDTPSTMAGSEIWTSFHADRSSTMSTATTYSVQSAEESAQHDDEIRQSSKVVGAVSPALEQDEGACPDSGTKEKAAAEPPIRRNSSKSLGSNLRSSLPRKSSGLPVYASKIAKPKCNVVDPNARAETVQDTDNAVISPVTPHLPSPSLTQSKGIKPSRSQHRISDQTSSPASKVSSQPRTIRRYHSLANLQRPKGLSQPIASEEKQLPVLPFSSLKVPSTVSRPPATPPKSITPPSKLPALRATPSKIGLYREATSATTLPSRVGPFQALSPNSLVLSPRPAKLQGSSSLRPSGLPSPASRIPKAT